MIKFIMEQVNKYKEDKISIDTIKLVKYTERIIPLWNIIILIMKK